jgi:hypothetical protein
MSTPHTTRHDRGETRSKHDQSSDAAAHPHSEPQLPHEADQSHHSQARGSERQVEVGKKAYKDTIGPAEDTDRGPVLDEVYNRSIAPERGDKPPRQ